MKNSTKCPSCEGRGVLYAGAPDALDTPTEQCHRCHGTGHKPTQPKRELAAVK